MSAPDLSICILNWNTKDLLRECLRSLFETRHGFGGILEIIVADNASEDGSADMVRHEFPQARLVQNERNLLYAAGNNAAAAQANGRYVCFLNSDTLVDCAELTKMISFMDVHRAAGICGPLQLDGQGAICRVQDPFPSVGFYLRRLVGLNRHRTSAYQPGDDPVLLDVVSGACLIIRADLGRRLGYFDERFDLYANDVDLCFRARQAGYEVWYLPNCQIVHHGGRSTDRMSDEATDAKFLTARIAFLDRHYGPVRARVLKALFVAQMYRWVLTRALGHALSLGRSQRRRERLHGALRLLRALRQRQ
ncbi:MAG: glycosyltransferase family 2 protein [Armatimonadota bacterium]